MNKAIVLAIAISASWGLSAAEWPYEGYGADLTKCEVEQGGTFEYNSRFSKWACNPESRKKCESQGGMWVATGRSGIGSCARIAKDRGKSCTDNRQCEFGCIYMGTPRQADGSVVGVCAFLDRAAGCQSSILNGQVSSVICVD